MSKRSTSKFSLSNHYGTVFNQMTSIQMYKFAEQFCSKKKVLDVGCSIGRGLGLISKKASFVVGLDIDKNAIEIAKINYQNNKKIKLINGNIEKLDINIGIFDTILIYQAIYLMDVRKTIESMKNLLNKNGQIVLMSINPDRHDFNPSKFATTYHEIDELKYLFNQEGFDCDLYGSIHDKQINYRGNMHSVIKWLKFLASKMKIIPSNYKFKKILKRIFYGPLKEIPDDVNNLRNVKYIEPKKFKNKSEYKDYIAFYLVAKLN